VAVPNELRIWEPHDRCPRCQTEKPRGLWKERDSEVLLCVSCGAKYPSSSHPKPVEFDLGDLDIASQILKRLKATPRRAMSRVMVD